MNLIFIPKSINPSSFTTFQVIYMVLLGCRFGGGICRQQFCRTVLLLIRSWDTFFSKHICRYYTIVASENIRPQSDYRVSVSVHNQTGPTSIKLSIEDEDDVISMKEITLSSDETKLVVLPVEDLNVNNNLKFIAEGESGIIFKNCTLLNVESKNCSIFIQTDKALYKPGEAIKFRILVLDFNLKPFELDDVELKVFITVKYAFKPKEVMR